MVFNIEESHFGASGVKLIAHELSVPDGTGLGDQGADVDRGDLSERSITPTRTTGCGGLGWCLMQRMYSHP